MRSTAFWLEPIDLGKRYQAMTKSQKIKYAEKKLWEVFSEYIRSRDGWKCVTCGFRGHRSQMHCGHLIPRGRKVIKYSELNNHCQCYKCNVAHSNVQCGYVYTNWFFHKYGIEKHDRLKNLAERFKNREAFKQTPGYLERRIKVFTYKLNQIKAKHELGEYND